MFYEKKHVDFIYMGIFPRSLDRAIEDWTRGRVSIAMLQEKDRTKEKAEEIRTLWRKYKSLSSVLAECMQRAIGASLHDRMSMLEEEFPILAKELNDEVKERRKNRSETRKERKENVDRTHTLANRRTSVEEGKEDRKKDGKTSKFKHICQGDFCLGGTFESIRPKVKSPEALCRKCTNLKTNLKASSQMEALLFRLITKDSLAHHLRPIHLFESTEKSATTKEDLIDAIRKVAGVSTLWNKLWSNRLKKKDFNKPVTVHTYYSVAVCMLANYLAIPILIQHTACQRLRKG